MKPKPPFTEFDATKSVKIDKMEVINDSLVFVLDDDILDFTDSAHDKYKHYYFIFCEINSDRTRSQVIAHLTSGAFNFEYHATFLEAEFSSDNVKRQIISKHLKWLEEMPMPWPALHLNGIFKNTINFSLS